MHISPCIYIYTRMYPHSQWWYLSCMCEPQSTYYTVLNICIYDIYSTYCIHIYYIYLYIFIYIYISHTHTYIYIYVHTSTVYIYTLKGIFFIKTYTPTPSILHPSPPSPFHPLTVANCISRRWMNVTPSCCRPCRKPPTCWPRLMRCRHRGKMVPVNKKSNGGGGWLVGWLVDQLGAQYVLGDHH